jgi:hypothetical protein
MRIRSLIEIEGAADLADGSFDFGAPAPVRREAPMADFAFDPFPGQNGRIEFGPSEPAAPRKRIPGQIYH